MAKQTLLFVSNSKKMFKGPQPAGCRTDGQPHRPCLAALTEGLVWWSSCCGCKASAAEEAADAHGTDTFSTKGKETAPPKS